MAEKDKTFSLNPAPVPAPVRGVSVDTEDKTSANEYGTGADVDNDFIDNQNSQLPPLPPQNPLANSGEKNEMNTNADSFVDTEAMFMDDEPVSGEIEGQTPAPLSFEPDPPKDPVRYGSLENKIEHNDHSFEMTTDNTSSTIEAGQQNMQESEMPSELPPSLDITSNENETADLMQTSVVPPAPVIPQKNDDSALQSDENTQAFNNISGKLSFPIERINIQPKPKDNIQSQLPTENAAGTKALKREDAPKKTNYTSPNFLKELFSNGNECITAPGGSYVISDTTRSMLALFSNGRFFVAENHKYDGPPLLFVTDTRRRRLQIGQPEYVPQVVINNIYEYAAKMRSKTPADVEESNQEQARMQRDFVTIVSKAAANHVSDIHIVVADHTTVMFRMNGLMQTEMEYNRDWGESFVRAAFASADISDANYAQNEYQAAQKVGKTALRGSNGKLTLPRNVQGIRLQFNPIAFGTRYVVMRLLYDEDNAESAGDLAVLGFEPQEIELFYRMRAIPTGIVIVAGPTGSGKSTTLQRNMISMLQERNYELNLITVEDPPEYPIPGARQMPVTNATSEEAKDREFTKALAAALRSDPDALMIGEIRTLAAADLAFRGALSGHSVWTTLHANSAPAIMMRLKDMGVEDFKLQDPSIMKGMLSQRLFRKICPYCRIRAKDRLDNPAVQRLKQAYGDMGIELSYLRGPGCKHCEYRGVKGRTVVGEFLLPDATFLDLMIRGESKKAMDYWVTELNGRTLREAAQARMLKGVIDIDEVERWTGLFNDITI